MQGCEQGTDIVRAVARPDAKGIARLVRKVMTVQVESDMPGFFFRAGTVEKLIVQHAGDERILTAVVAAFSTRRCRCFSAFDDRDLSVRQFGTDTRYPMFCRLLVIRIAFLARL
ncbi:hypothetical protein D3C71_1443200 [compost metagenome]